jgi:hypothetical protein
MPRFFSLPLVFSFLAVCLSGCVDRVDLCKEAVGGVLEAWDAGHKQQAVFVLLKVDWEDKDFEPLPGEQKQVWQTQEKQREITEKVAVLQELAVAAMLASQQADEEGNAELAQEYRQAVSDMGRYLSRPEHSQLIQLVGKAVIRIRHGDLDVELDELEEDPK